MDGAPSGSTQTAVPGDSGNRVCGWQGTGTGTGTERRPGREAYGFAKRQICKLGFGGWWVAVARAGVGRRVID